MGKRITNGNHRLVDREFRFLILRKRLVVVVDICPRRFIVRDVVFALRRVSNRGRTLTVVLEVGGP
jgi:hypothetical protein